MTATFWEEYETAMALDEWFPEKHRENTWWAKYAYGIWARWLRRIDA